MSCSSCRVYPVVSTLLLACTQKYKSRWWTPHKNHYSNSCRLTLLLLSFKTSKVRITNLYWLWFLPPSFPFSFFFLLISLSFLSLGTPDPGPSAPQGTANTAPLPNPWASASSTPSNRQQSGSNSSTTRSVMDRQTSLIVVVFLYSTSTTTTATDSTSSGQSQPSPADMFSQVAEMMQGNPDLMRAAMQQGAGGVCRIATVINLTISLISAAGWYDGDDAEPSVPSDVFTNDAEPSDERDDGQHDE